MSDPKARPLATTTPELVASLLGDGYDVRLRVAGWSMKPLIRSGALIRFSPTTSFRRGDVVLTRAGNGALVAHRVVALDGIRVWTKGDACRHGDAPVERRSVVGCAVALEGRVRLPLRAGWVRSLGLGLNRFYPLLTMAARGVFPRKKRSC